MLQQEVFRRAHSRYNKA